MILKLLLCLLIICLKFLLTVSLMILKLLLWLKFLLTVPLMDFLTMAGNPAAGSGLSLCRVLTTSEFRDSDSCDNTAIKAKIAKTCHEKVCRSHSCDELSRRQTLREVFMLEL